MCFLFNNNFCLGGGVLYKSEGGPWGQWPPFRGPFQKPIIFTTSSRFADVQSVKEELLTQPLSLLKKKQTFGLFFLNKNKTQTCVRIALENI